MKFQSRIKIQKEKRNDKLSHMIHKLDIVTISNTISNTISRGKITFILYFVLLGSGKTFINTYLLHFPKLV